jgi:hypothetical protein
MPPSSPGPRERLAEFMERRRRELGLRWQDVSDASGISVRALQAIRRPDSAPMRALTKARLETGLQWAPGSVQAIEDGGKPVPLARTGPAQPPSQADTDWLPPISERSRDDARPFADAIWTRLVELGVKDPAGRQVFPAGSSPTADEDAAEWDRQARLFTVAERVWMIAEAWRRGALADERQRGTGLAKPGLDRS